MIDTVLSACPYILLLSMCSCEIRNTNKSILINAFNIYRMALTNAERQKRWREKQKEKNKTQYLKSERMRKKGTYIPTHRLTPEQQEKRRKKCREDYKKYYIRKKKNKQSLETVPEETMQTRSTKDKSAHPLMTVKMSFANKAKATGVRKRHSNALRNANREIAALTQKVKTFKEIKKKLLKRLERKAQSQKEISTPSGSNICEDREASTPRSKTKLMLKKAGLKIDMRSRLPRKLILGNALIDNLAKDRNFAPRKRKTIKGNMAVRAMAEVIKKYRCIKQVGKELGISTNTMKNMHICKVHPSIKTKYGDKVRLFLEREDNSTVLPGKRDVKIHKKIVMQKRILNDYLHNLHQKFLMEFPDLKISLSSFCRLRPIHVLPTSLK